MEVIDFNTDYLEKLKEHEVKIENNIKGINEIEHKVDDLSEMKENIKLLTYIQKEQNLFNKEQARVNAEVSNTLVAINGNLKNMSKKLNETDQKVESLQCKFEEVEKKNTIDIREIQKEETKKKLTTPQKIALGIGGTVGGSAVAVGLIEIIKALVELIGK